LKAPSLDLSSLADPPVRSAAEALQMRDEGRWFDQFSANAGFSDDGIEHDLRSWCKEELFGPWRAHLISIDGVEDGGLTFYATYHSDKWGDFKTFWRFQTANGKISRLDVGATDH
jgi:hypothetical protein